MLGPQTEIETRLWCVEVPRSMGGVRQDTAEDAMQRADDLLAAYRLRYGLPQPAADDRLGKAAIAAMDSIMGAIREARRDAETLTLIERAVQRYMGERWHIQKETGK